MSGFENVVILFTLMTHIPLYWIILQRYSLLHLVKQSDSVKVFQPPYLYLLEEQLPQRAHTTDDVVLQMLAPVSLFVIEHSCSLSAVKPFFSLLPIEDRRLRKVRYLSEETVKNKKTTTKNTTTTTDSIEHFLYFCFSKRYIVFLLFVKKALSFLFLFFSIGDDVI